MKNYAFLLMMTFSVIYSTSSAQQIYLAKGGLVSFFSESPMENIDAKTNSMTSVLNIATNDIVFTVPLRTFAFKKALMEEHFNEKYVESEKYPKTEFKGKINENITWDKDGTYSVTATGTFDLHGVKKITTEKGKIIIKNGVITLDADFKITLADYKIEVPKLVESAIAKTIDIKTRCDYTLYKKPAK